MTKQVNPRVKNNDLDLVFNYDEEVLMVRIDTDKIKQVFTKRYR